MNAVVVYGYASLIMYLICFGLKWIRENTFVKLCQRKPENIGSNEAILTDRPRTVEIMY